MEKFKILAEFVKDISVETKDVQTYLVVKEYISKYQLTIDIQSVPAKNKPLRYFLIDSGWIHPKLGSASTIDQDVGSEFGTLILYIPLSAKTIKSDIIVPNP